TTARGASGYAVDFLFRPTTYLLTPAAQIVWTGLTQGGSGIALRDANADALRALEVSAVDYYAALRNAWWQNEEAAVRTRRDAPLRIVNLWPRLWGSSLAPAGSQVVDTGAQRRDESVETVAFEH